MQKILILFVLILNSSLAIAQNNSYNDQEEIQKQFREIMRQRDEMLKSLMNDDAFESMEKRMQQMMQRFSDDDFDFSGSSFFGGSVVGEYDWKENEKYKILSIKVKQIKDRPLDIKIEKGMIILKGDVEEVQANNGNLKNKPQRISKVHFERSFSIPTDVDQKNPEFENKDGELLIKFKKMAPKKMMDNKGKTKTNEERIPVTPQKDDISI